MAHNYTIMDEIAQYYVAMSTLEVQQYFPKKSKALLSTLGAIDRYYSHLMDFDLDKSTTEVPSLVAF